MPRKRYPRVSIIGAGAVGSSIGRALFKKGYPIASVINRTGSAAVSLARAVRCKRASTQIADLAADSELILLTVTDSAIADVGAQVSRVRSLNFKKLTALHCSGVHSADILAPLRRRGALVASMHPIQTFSSPGNPALRRPVKRRANLRGIYYGIEGDPAALEHVKQLVADLGGKTVIIRKELKPLYHVICVFASNYLLVFLNSISELTRFLSVQPAWTEMFGPLMMTTAENGVKDTAPSSLTGPIVRGDLPTVDLHLNSLSHYAPEFLPLYTMGGIEVARIARDRGKISRDDYDHIIVRFRQFLKRHPFTNNRKVKR